MTSRWVLVKRFLCVRAQNGAELDRALERDVGEGGRTSDSALFAVKTPVVHFPGEKDWASRVRVSHAWWELEFEVGCWRTD